MKILSYGMCEGADSETGTITSLLRQMKAGDASAQDRLFDHVHDDLRRMAQGILTSGGWPKAGVQGTELVSMACLRLLGRAQLDAEDRRHFFFLLGRAMQDVLVEEARKATAKKRGGGWSQSPMVEFSVESEHTQFDLLALREAMNDLCEHDPETANVVSMLFFGGRTMRETAEIMGCSLAKVRGHWDYARAWLGARAAERDR